MNFTYLTIYIFIEHASPGDSWVVWGWSLKVKFECRRSFLNKDILGFTVVRSIKKKGKLKDQTEGKSKLNTNVLTN